MTTSILLLLLCSLLCTVAVAPNAGDNPQPPPNVILFFLDDAGYGDTGFTGHPTISTPNLDELAKEGKIFTTWYSGCPVCSGSRAALMTGRQYLRSGIPAVLGSTGNLGLPLNETTVAEQLKRAGYATAAVGKWHLGQRQVYLPANRGFDYYLGIPYSVDMGRGRQSPCPAGDDDDDDDDGNTKSRRVDESSCQNQADPWSSRVLYENLGYDTISMRPVKVKNASYIKLNQVDPAGLHLPLVYQGQGETRVLEQPLDLTTLSVKYNAFCTNFIQQATGSSTPFFLYVPFDHPHVTADNIPEQQFASCQFVNSTKRGIYGDALADVDWIVGNILEAVRSAGVEDNTLILFASDNGPWLGKGTSGGSVGLLTGRYAGYYDTGKGSTWEGGIRSPAFAYWKGKIQPGSRTTEVVSSLDIMPTLSALAGVPLPANVSIDGKDMSNVLFDGGKSEHEFLFLYGTCGGKFSEIREGFNQGVAAIRHGKYKAHWCTGPGLSGIGARRFYKVYPLLFDVEKDPSESIPISNGTMPTDPEDAAAMERILKASAFEVATFTYGTIVPEPDAPGEGPGTYGVCCDRLKDCNCDTDDGDGTVAGPRQLGLLNVGTKRHHDAYHTVLQKEQPLPPRTRAQAAMLMN